MPWRLLPIDFPPWKTVYHVFRKWARDCVWKVINDLLRTEVLLLQEQLTAYQGLELGEEIARGTLEGDIEVGVGDNLVEKLGQAEILVQDDVVKEIRDPAAR